MNGEEEIRNELTDLVGAPRSEENDDKIERHLLRIVEDGVNYTEDVVGAISELLGRNGRPNLVRLAARSIAELCKCDKRRIAFTRPDIVEKLLPNLRRRDDAELTKQSCRALGNICYESYIGRDAVLNAGGVPAVVALLPATLDGNLGAEVRLYACKLLFILALGGGDYINPALDCDLVAALHRVVRHEFSSPEGDDDRLHTALLILSVVTEYTRTLIVPQDLTLLIVDILKTVKNMEISEVCLEYLHYQAEHDQVKTALAKANVPQILWNLLQQHKTLAVDEESRELMKLACDLIALILTGDASMTSLYADGKGDFYLSMIDSLSSDDIELSITAILAIGNFARTDTHCIQMMDSGVFSKLMSILVLHKSQEDDIRLQHVVLSGLRNLVIPQKNKVSAVEKGVLPLLIEMLPNVTQYHVVFKLLATLRMLVDGQESVAEDLVSSGVLDRVANWGLQSEHNGVSGEASRLLARLLRQLQSPSSLIKMTQVKGCIPCLVNMLTASHAIMQNEAIIALTVLCTVCFPNLNTTDQNHVSEDASDKNCNELFVEELTKAELVKQLNVMLEKNFDKIQSELCENMCKFFTLVMSVSSIKSQIIENNSKQLLQRLVSESNNLNDKAKKSVDVIIAEMSQNVDESEK